MGIKSKTVQQNKEISAVEVLYILEYLDQLNHNINSIELKARMKKWIK